MSVLPRILERRFNDAAVRSAMTRSRYGLTPSGQRVDAETALRHVAVLSAVNMIADTVSTLPLDEIRTMGGQKEELTPSMILTNPDPDMSDVTGFVRQLIVSTLLTGNAWVLPLNIGRSGYPIAARVVDPSDIKVSRKGKLGRLNVMFNGAEQGPGEYYRMSAYEMPGSPLGVSPITYAANMIGVGLAAGEFGARFFGDDGHPLGLLSYDGQLDASSAQIAQERWLENWHSRRPSVLGKGWDYKPLSVTPNDSQFLETMNANGAMIATIFGLRPEDLGYKSGDSMTYANVEQRQLARLVYPMSGWIVRTESFLSSMLPRGRQAKFNVDALVRVDLKTRTEVQVMRIRNGLTSPNEERILDDLDPYDGGDIVAWPPTGSSNTTATTGATS